MRRRLGHRVWPALVGVIAILVAIAAWTLSPSGLRETLRERTLDYLLPLLAPEGSCPQRPFRRGAIVALRGLANPITRLSEYLDCFVDAHACSVDAECADLPKPLDLLGMQDVC
jgi:hypothetical protein